MVLGSMKSTTRAFYSDYIWPLWTGRLPGSAQWKRGGSRDDYDESLNGNGEKTELEVPYVPQRIAILDMASLDILDSLGLVESVRSNASVIASMFGKEAEIEELMSSFEERIQKLADFADKKTAIVGMCTSGSFNILGSDGRCSIISIEIGFQNIGVDADADTSTHGNEASFEFIVEKNPEYLFVMDRDAAIGTDGAQLAKEIVENELVMDLESELLS